MEVCEPVPCIDAQLMGELLERGSLGTVWTVDVSEKVCLLSRRSGMSSFHELLNVNLSSLLILICVFPCISYILL
jgi:hypothetical protein